MTQPPVDQPDETAAPAARTKPGRGSPPLLTMALGGVLILVLGFFGGIGVAKLTGGSGGQPQAFPSGYGKRFSTNAPGRQGGGNVTIGTVERVVGSTVYVRTPDGKTVKVNTSDDTSVHVSKPGAVSDLTKGSTVVVRGDSKDGTVDADRIDEGGVNVRQGASPTP